MTILTDTYLSDYLQRLDTNIHEAWQGLEKMELTPQSFTFYTSVAVMSSARIEGEPLEIDSYVKHKMQDIEYLPELTEKPNDLSI